MKRKIEQFHWQNKLKIKELGSLVSRAIMTVNEWEPYDVTVSEEKRATVVSVKITITFGLLFLQVFIDSM